VSDNALIAALVGGVLLAWVIRTWIIYHYASKGVTTTEDNEDDE
jgi:hypothetical protein